MSNSQIRTSSLEVRKRRTRAKLAENIALPRLSVHRSLRHMYAQIIDDRTGVTLAAANDAAPTVTGTKIERATRVGTSIAELAQKAKVTHVRFDRGGRKYHGRIAAVAEAARTAGLQF